jgi:tRNA A-37 threonylcarbamoyl transferase component Bud32
LRLIACSGLIPTMSWEAGGTVGGRYTLTRRLGEGGMGVVWSATHNVTRKPVALKAILATHKDDRMVVQRFIREARAACAVRHPNIVEVHDVLEVDDGLPVMVMELLEGESLASRLQREGALPLAEVAKLMLPAISAIASAHALGIVHRDLKPDNIFLAQSPTGVTVKILDFGIAKLTATEGDHAATGALTGTGAMLGTPYYKAPEHMFGEKDVDQRADVWALGVILYECLAGVRPTQADSIGQILKIVTRDGVPSLRTVRPDLPDEVLDLVDKLLTSDRAKRPRDVHVVEHMLSRFTTWTPSMRLAISGQGLTEWNDSSMARASTVALSATDASAARKAAQAPSRRAWLIGVATVAVGGVALTVALTTHKQAGATIEPLATSATVVDAAIAPMVATTTQLPSLPSAAATTAPVVSSSKRGIGAAPTVDAGPKPVASSVTPPAASSGRPLGGVVDSLPF